MECSMALIMWLRSRNKIIKQCTNTLVVDVSAAIQNFATFFAQGIVVT